MGERGSKCPPGMCELVDGEWDGISGNSESQTGCGMDFRREGKEGTVLGLELERAGNCIRRASFGSFSRAEEKLMLGFEGELRRPV